MSDKMYDPGDKIFAKVRGYPPWPARVDSIADRTPNRMKYNVLFYGTEETGICKPADMFPYIENRKKYGKRSKKRIFNEAIKQIEIDLENSIPVSNDSQGGLIENDGKEDSLGCNKTCTQMPSKKLKLRNSKSSDTDGNAVQSMDVTENNNLREENSPQKNAKFTRSGRKIKPKKFLDEFDEDKTFNVSKVKPVQDKNKNVGKEGTSNELNKSQSTSECVKTEIFVEIPVDSNFKITENDTFSIDDQILDSEFFEDGVLTGITPSNQLCKFILHLNQPTFHNEELREEWENNLRTDGKKIKYFIEHFGNMPQEFKETLIEKYNAQLIHILQNKTPDYLNVSDFNEKSSFLNTEIQLLRLDCMIKCSLSVDEKPNPKDCLEALEEMLHLKIKTLMLIKHTSVMLTVKKLLRYSGNVPEWNMTPDEMVTFLSEAAEIRTKAGSVLDKFKGLFLVPCGKSFLIYYDEKVSEFNRKTGHLTGEEVNELIVDPTEFQDDEDSE